MNEVKTGLVSRVWTFCSLCSSRSLHIGNFVYSSYIIIKYVLFIRFCLRTCPMQLLEYHFQNQCAGTLRYAKFVLNWCGHLILVWNEMENQPDHHASLPMILLIIVHLFFIVLSKWLLCLGILLYQRALFQH